MKYIEEKMTFPQLLVRNPSIVFLIGKEDPDSVQFVTLDTFHFHEIGKIANLQQKLEDRLYEFFCNACQTQVKSISELVEHCQSEDHDKKEDLCIKLQNEANIAQMKFSIEQTGLVSIKKTMTPDSVRDLIGLSFMLELYPEEYDEPPIYICSLLPCEFIGFATDILDHAKSPEHRRGYLEVNGVTQSNLENQSEDDLISCLHEYDLANTNQPIKSPENLLKRVVNTYDYQCALIGKYPPAYHDFVMEKVLVEYNENRQPKVYAVEPSTSTPSTSKTHTSSATKSRKLSEIDGKTKASDVYEHLGIVKQEIRNIVLEEFQRAGRLTGPNMITNSIIRQLSVRYYQDEKLFFEDDLKSFIISEQAEERIRDRVLNFLYAEAKNQPTLLTDFK